MDVVRQLSMFVSKYITIVTSYFINSTLFINLIEKTFNANFHYTRVCEYERSDQ